MNTFIQTGNAWANTVVTGIEPKIKIKKED